MLDRLRGGDAQAWHRLVALLGPRVYQWCRRSGLQPEDAADVLQEVFQSVAAKLDGFERTRPEDTFHGWLRVITQNKIRDHFRRRARQPEAIGGTDASKQFQQLADRGDRADSDELSMEESRRFVAQQVLNIIRRDFDEKTWKAFWGMTSEGRSSAEVGQELGMAKDAVRQAKRRVLCRLREELDGVIEI